MTATLALVYVSSVVLLQQFFRPILGQSNDVTIVVSTLATAAVFQPLRWHIQNVIDRRFFRGKYDAQKTLQALNARLRDETELGHLTGDIVEVEQNTFQPVHVSMWLKESTTQPLEREGRSASSFDTSMATR